MERRREQAAAKQTFVFLHSLTSMRLSETDRECEARACEYGKKKRASGCEAKETYGSGKVSDTQPEMIYHVRLQRKKEGF